MTIELAIPLLIVGLTLALAWPLGRYMRWAIEPAAPGPVRRAYEQLCERLLGRFAALDQDWKRYVLQAGQRIPADLVAASGDLRHGHPGES